MLQEKVLWDQVHMKIIPSLLENPMDGGA